MSHNYAKPLTPEARLARLLSRVPPEWEIALTRPSNEGWTARLAPPGHAPITSAPHPTPTDALDEAWRQARQTTE